MITLTNNTTESSSARNGVVTSCIWGTIFFIEVSAVILANLLTIITFSINRHLRKRSMYCVINLAVADMLFGVGELVTFLWGMQSSVYYLWRIILVTFMGLGTLYSLALVAVERMCATACPLCHRNARSWAYTLAISMTWAAAAMAGLLTAIVRSAVPDSTLFLYLFLGLVIAVAVGVICISYIVIFIKVKQQQQKMAGHGIDSGQDKRLAMTLLIVTVLSIGAWIPLALTYLLTAIDVVVDPGFVVGLASFLAFSNSLINPIVYVFRMKDFRKALLRLIFKCSRDRPTQVVPQANLQQAVPLKTGKNTEQVKPSRTTPRNVKKFQFNRSRITPVYLQTQCCSAVWQREAFTIMPNISSPTPLSGIIVDQEAQPKPKGEVTRSPIELAIND